MARTSKSQREESKEKEPGMEEEEVAATVPPTLSLLSASTSQCNQAVTSVLEEVEVPKVVRTKKENVISFTELDAQSIGVTQHELQFMTGQQIRARSEMELERAYQNQGAKQTRRFRAYTKPSLHKVFLLCVKARYKKYEHIIYRSLSFHQNKI